MQRKKRQAHPTARIPFHSDVNIEAAIASRKCDRPSQTWRIIASSLKALIWKRRREGRRFQGVLYLFNAKWGTPCDR